MVFFLEASRGQGQCPLICFVGPTSEKVGRSMAAVGSVSRALLNRGAWAAVKS